MLTLRPWLLAPFLACVAVAVFGGVLLAATLAEPANRPLTFQHGASDSLGPMAAVPCVVTDSAIAVDYNSNSKIDIGDIQQVAYHWNATPYDPAYDLNIPRDHLNNTSDVQIEASVWRQTCHYPIR